MDVADGSVLPGFADFEFDHADFNFDLELAADEFYHAYSAFVATAADSSAGKSCGGGWIAGSGGGGSGEGSGETSPRSGLTDGPLAAADDDGSDMSAYVAELERILTGDADADLGDVAAACPDGTEICVDDYFLGGDDVLAGVAHVDGIAAAPDGAGRKRNAEDKDEVNLAAREDDQASSTKRARRKRINKSTTMIIPWGELEVAMAHLARIQKCRCRGHKLVALVRCM